ncbi:MAG: protein kinase, partial [Planctomycetes bacterium]|nr:protein kinase [Planctomycetota bacterium]
MNEVRTAHPDSEKLAAFAVGRLSDAESVSIEAHLAECEACRQVAADVPADSLMQLLQESSIDTRNDIVGGATPAEPPKPDSLPPLYKKVAKILTGKTESTLPFTPAKPLNVPRELEAHPRYEVLALLGSGGMGTVYKARHRLMDRLVALKVINPVLVNQPGAVERFTREVKAAAQLTAPNIVHAYDAEQAGGTHFLVMEYVEGKMLADLVKEKGSLPVGQACEYMRQTAVGLQHALERGMVHRDIKPQNLMVSTSPGSPPVVKILDFGLARFVSECAPAGATTAVGAMMGSPDYMAPEQATDAHTADARADIYSMGCTLYQLLAGQVPFPDTPLLKKLEAHRDRSAIPLNHLRADVSPELAAIVTKMMAKDPAQRYQKPAEVAAALGPFVNVEPVPKPAPVRISESMRPFYRKPAFVAAVAICLLLLGGGIFLAPYVLRVQTETGTLIITSDDPDVQIEVKSGGKTVVLFFPKEKKHIELKAGEYTIELVGG